MFCVLAIGGRRIATVVFIYLCIFTTKRPQTIMPLFVVVLVILYCEIIVVVLEKLQR